MKKNFIIQFVICLSLAVNLQANQISILPLAQRVLLKTNEIKTIYFRVFNQTINTQIINLQLENGPNNIMANNISWKEWCFPEKWQFEINPHSYKDWHFSIKYPLMTNTIIIKKLMTMCFFSSHIKPELINQTAGIIVKTRIGVALYAEFIP